MFATVNEDSNEAVITMDDLTISPIVERDESSDSDAHRELCYRLDWEPILQPTTPSEITPSASNGESNNKSNGVSNGVHTSPNNSPLNGISVDVSPTDSVSASSYFVIGAI